MALTPRLEIRQAQSLTLTPQLMQSIKLLQLSHLELSAFVEAELERNPLLEQPDSAPSENGASDPNESPEQNTAQSEEFDQDAAQNVEQLGDHMGAASDIASSMDTDVENVFPEQVGQDSVRQSTHQDNAIGGGGAYGDEGPDLEAYVPSTVTLSEHLALQANLLLHHLPDRMIAHSLIDSLDEAGYLTAEPEYFADQLGTDVEDVLAVLQELRGCDPVGVFARNVPECLAIQLQERDRLDPMMQKLIDNIELLATHETGRLLKLVGCDREDLADMLAELRQLDPKPGLKFDGVPMQAIVADVFVREGPDGGWAIELNSDILPRVLVNRTYYANVTKKLRGRAEKEFLVDCLQTANWLTKSLDQRAQTILKVATEIVRTQDAFLVHGVTQLKPMTLKMVADEIDMHESTVSRVTTSKYISTPRGLFEMKYFFTTALSSTAGGADHSAESVRYLIKQMVDAEDPRKILSDDKISARMKDEHDIEVARRTVTKYREATHIPSSVIRRRQKRELSRAQSQVSREKPSSF